MIHRNNPLYFPYSPFKRMVFVLPEGQVGSARIEHYEITEKMAGLNNAIAAGKGRRFETVDPGRHVRLMIGESLVMSDTQMERWTNGTVVKEAKGDVLIAGLGLGLVVVPILAKPEVRSVLVIEKNPDVISLVTPALCEQRGGRKLKVVQADIFEWQPEKGRTWDTIYFDIWTSPNTDDLEEQARLHRRFGRRKSPGGWMASWWHDLLLDQRRRGY
jgi:spermidine synthase